MPSSRLYNVDTTTAEGQSKILTAWSGAILDLSQAASILKIIQSEPLELAIKRGFSPPSPEMIAMRDAELEGYFRPLAQYSERKRVREGLESMISQLDNDVLRLKLIIKSSNTPELEKSRSLAEQVVVAMGTARSAISSATALLIDSIAADEVFNDAKGDSLHGVDE